MSAAPLPNVVKTNGVYHVEGRPRETLKVLAHHRPPNMPGKSFIALLIEQEPNAAAPPHTHNGAAVLGLMIEGNVLNQMNSDEPFKVTKGQTWYEAPGCHHVRGENASTTEGAKFFAVLVVDDEVVKDGYEGLVVIDKAVEDAKASSNTI